MLTPKSTQMYYPVIPNSTMASQWSVEKMEFCTLALFEMSASNGSHAALS